MLYLKKKLDKAHFSSYLMFCTRVNSLRWRPNCFLSLHQVIVSSRRPLKWVTSPAAIMYLFWWTIEARTFKMETVFVL